MPEQVLGSLVSAMEASLALQGNNVYESDEFRLYCHKILPCSKRTPHDWANCPFAHPGEKAKRRNIRTHQYDCEMCESVVKGEECLLGSSCPHAHNVFESWLHPQKYRTMLCKDRDKCARPLCFFAHGPGQLRTPTCVGQVPQGLSGSSAVASADCSGRGLMMGMNGLQSQAADTVQVSAEQAGAASNNWSMQSQQMLQMQNLTRHASNASSILGSSESSTPSRDNTAASALGMANNMRVLQANSNSSTQQQTRLLADMLHSARLAGTQQQEVIMQRQQQAQQCQQQQQQEFRAMALRNANACMLPVVQAAAAPSDSVFSDLLCSTPGNLPQLVPSAQQQQGTSELQGQLRPQNNQHAAAARASGGDSAFAAGNLMCIEAPIVASSGMPCEVSPALPMLSLETLAQFYGPAVVSSATSMPMRAGSLLSVQSRSDSLGSIPMRTCSVASVQSRSDSLPNVVMRSDSTASSTMGLWPPQLLARNASGSGAFAIQAAGQSAQMQVPHLTADATGAVFVASNPGVGNTPITCMLQNSQDFLPTFPQQQGIAATSAGTTSTGTANWREVFQGGAPVGRSLQAPARCVGAGGQAQGQLQMQQLLLQATAQSGGMLHDQGAVFYLS